MSYHDATLPLDEFIATCLPDEKKTAAKRELHTLFDRLGMPLPQENQYYVANAGSGGTLVFLERYGVAMYVNSIEHHEYGFEQTFAHPLLIQPLAHWRGQHIGVSMYPGIGQRWMDGEAANSEDGACEHLSAILKKDGLYHDDPAKWNRGVIPIATDDFPSGIPILMDPKYAMLNRFCSPPDFKAEHVAGQLNIHPITLEYAPIVKDYFAEATGHVADAWPMGELPTKAKIGYMWGRLADLTARGRLVSGWTDKEAISDVHSPEDADTFADISHNYDQSIREHRMRAL